MMNDGKDSAEKVGRERSSFLTWLHLRDSSRGENGRGSGPGGVPFVRESRPTKMQRLKHGIRGQVRSHFRIPHSFRSICV